MKTIFITLVLCICCISSAFGEYLPLSMLKYDDNQYVLATKEDITIFDSKTKSFEYVARLPVSSILKVDDKIYIGSSNGLYVLDFPSRAMKKLTGDFAVTTLLYNNGTLYIGTQRGLHFYRVNENDFGYFTSREFYSRSITALEYHSDTLYIGTLNGLFVFDLKNNNISAVTVESGLPNNHINCIYYNNNELWIGCDDTGVGVYDLVTGEWEYFSITSNNYKTLSSNVVVKIIADPGEENIMWFATYHGNLTKFNRITQKWKWIVHCKTRVRDIHFDEKTSNMLVAWGKYLSLAGFSEFDRRRNKWSNCFPMLIDWTGNYRQILKNREYKYTFDK